jgi:hypothetical protein
MNIKDFDWKPETKTLKVKVDDKELVFNDVTWNGGTLDESNQYVTFKMKWKKAKK